MPLLDVPAQHDLGWRTVVGRRRIRHLREFEQRVLTLPERTPGLGEDAVVVTVRGFGRTLVIGVQFDLVDRRYRVAPPFDAVEVLNQEVAHPDRHRLARCADLFEGLPALEVQVALRGRPVNQIQVDMIEPQLVETDVDRSKRCVVPLSVIPQLGRDEEFVARDSGCGDGPPDTLLVAVDRGGIDVAVADLERVGDNAFGVVRIDEEDSESKLWDAAAVVECEGGNSHAPMLSRAEAPART